jgi:hypothetical protein
MALTTVSPGLLDSNAQYYGFKNRIINGAMGISQRTAVNTNVAVGTGTAGTFGPDRFSGYTGTGSLWNISQVSTTAYDFPFALRLQRIAGQTSTSAVYLRQIIETVNCKDLAGQTVTLSFYATAGANYSGGAATVQLFTGTAADQGTTSLNTAAWTGLVSAINTTFTPTTTRTLFTFTGTLGATIQEVAFSINWSGSGTAGANDYIDITGVQLEKGSTATSFDYRPYGTEFDLCRRYCEVYSGSGDADGIPQFAGAVDVNNRPEIFVTYYPKRGTPSITVTNATTAFQITTMANTVLATTAYNGTSVGTGLNSSDLFWTVASGMTTNTLSGIGVLSFKASAKIIIDSEL